MGFSRIVRSATRAGMAHSGAASVSQRGAFAPFSMVPFQGGVMDASFSFSRWNPQGMPASHFALGAAGLLKGRYGISGSAVYQTGAPEGGFAPSDLHISLGVARGLSEHFSFGFGGHFVSSKLTASDRLSGFALDASVAFRTGGFSALVGLTQLGSASLGDDVYPMFLSCARGYRRRRPPIFLAGNGVRPRRLPLGKQGCRVAFVRHGWCRRQGAWRHDRCSLPSRRAAVGHNDFRSRLRFLKGLPLHPFDEMVDTVQLVRNVDALRAVYHALLAAYAVVGLTLRRDRLAVAR